MADDVCTLERLEFGVVDDITKPLVIVDETGDDEIGTLVFNTLDGITDPLLTVDETGGDEIVTLVFNVLDAITEPLVIFCKILDDGIDMLEYINGTREIEEFDVAGTSTSTVAVSPGGAV